MDIKPLLQIDVMIKAMENVVVPAISSQEKIAFEQASLVLATLRTLSQRLPLWFQYNYDELLRFTQLANQILAETGLKSDAIGVGYDELRSAASFGASVLDRAGVDPAQLEVGTLQLRTAIGELMAGIKAAGGSIHQSRLGKLVLTAAKTQVSRERAWLSTSGFDSHVSTVEPIEKQLADALESARNQIAR